MITSLYLEQPKREISNGDGYESWFSVVPGNFLFLPAENSLSTLRMHFACHLVCLDYRELGILDVI